MVVLQANTDDRFSPKPSKLEAFVSSAVLRASRAACLFERGFIILGVNKQVELNAALERARSEKKIEQEKALTAIQEEEDRARERCKVSTFTQIMYIRLFFVESPQTRNTEKGMRRSIVRVGVVNVQQAASEKELNIYLKTREGEAKLSRAAHKVREKAEFAWQMDRDAAGKGMVRMSKADSKAHARFDLKTEIYMRNVQKVRSVAGRYVP